MSRLFAIEAESFPKTLSLFFIDHGIDCSFDHVHVHCVWVSIGGSLAPGALISFLNQLLKVPILVMVVIVVVAVVFLLGGSGVLVNLTILDGLGEPSALVNSSTNCFCVFEGVRFVRISHDLHSKGWV